MLVRIEAVLLHPTVPYIAIHVIGKYRGIYRKQTGSENHRKNNNDKHDCFLMRSAGTILEDQINAGDVKDTQNDKYKNVELDSGFADKFELGKIGVKLEIKKIDQARNQAKSDDDRQGIFRGSGRRAILQGVYHIRVSPKERIHKRTRKYK